MPTTGGGRGGTVTGSRGGQISAGGVGGSRTGPGGTTIGAGRGAVSVTGPGGNTYTKVGGGAAIRGPGGNTVAAGRGASFVNGQFVGGRSWSAVNGAYTRWGTFTPGWYGRYPGLVAGQVGPGDHRLGPGSFGLRPVGTAVAVATAATMTTVKT